MEGNINGQSNQDVVDMILTSLIVFTARRWLIVLPTLLLLTAYVYRSPAPLSWLSLNTSCSSQVQYTQTTSDRWRPPHDWDGTIPVYDNFPSLNARYAPGTANLVRASWLQPQDPQPFPPYRLEITELFNNASPVPCEIPHGTTFEQKRGQVRRYLGYPHNFPQPALGSSILIGHEHDVCYDRFGRHGAYGLGDRTLKDRRLDWDIVDWGRLQEKCYLANKHRFVASQPVDQAAESEPGPQSTTSNNTILPQRTAILLRCHQHTEWTQELRRTIRSIIQELALYTSGTYAVFLLVEIKDEGIPIWDNPTAYAGAVDKFVPREFQNITLLWNVLRWRQEYPLIPVGMLNVHLSQWLPLQYFQKQYPEFDFYWNWEMDVRFTGHHHDLLQSIEQFTRLQPRKGLWERNARFYIRRKHGPYRQFRELIHARYFRNGKDSSIWGPHPPSSSHTLSSSPWLSHLQVERPESDLMSDDFTLGVGQQADLVTFLPMFNPVSTNYVYRDAHTNYQSSTGPSDIPRRTTIITFARLSARLLKLMEAENSQTPMHHMSSELWPHSISLHYGLKAVSIPHAIYFEQDWPAEALDFIFNNGDYTREARNRSKLEQGGEGSGGFESVFGLEREHNWERSTWYYRNRFAIRLYKRWLGWEVDGIGGRDWELRNGRYCLPPMLLHPIKTVEDPSGE